MGTNTGLGIGIGIPFKNNALGGDKPYFPPELKARMIGVWTNYGKKNTDADRNIIKNKIPNAGGDLEILNAAYKLNSGFGEYSEDFTTWIKSSKITSVNSESFDFVSDASFNLLYYKSNIGKDMPSFKVRIKLKGKGKVYYNYVTSEGVFTTKTITSEEYITPISYNTKYTGETPVNCGFTIGISDECSGTITQIPNFEDAFVTDGINDIIVSQKTLQEMGVTKGLTIVSMIHQINTNESKFITTNNLRTVYKVVGRNIVSNIDKTGIYGWYKENTEEANIAVINNILGDKNDYTSHSSPSTNIDPINNSKFYVQGYAVENGFAEISSIAHYWTFAVLGKATEDEINLIIGNYNLDRSLKPDILCNIGKQGITNDNHADFNDKLIDYSGNGRDVQMNNLAWKGGSGIAAKPFETIKDYTIVSDEARQKLTIYNEFSYKIKSNTPSYYWTVQSVIRDNTSYQVTIITDKDCYWINATSFINSEGNKESIRKKYPVLANTPTQVIICGLDQFEYPEGVEPTSAVSYVNLKYAGEITITFIPSHKGGLLLDGVNDFGKVIGMPIYKDYTVVTDREIFANTGTISSKNNPGAFVETAGNSVYSFGQATSGLNFISTRSISYLSKYSYCGQSITAGAAEDGTDMWLGTIRDNDYRFFNGVIYSLMSFPYSMNKFLIERQLKKHKLGTLYPNMVEFRPVIKSSVELASKPTFVIRGTSTLLNTGDYIPENSEIWVVITMNNAADRITKFVINGNTIDIPSSAYNPSTMKYGFPFTIDSKSPQKITMTIEQDENYVKFEPVITSNVEYVRLDFYLNNYQKRINIGDYIPKDVYLRANFYLKNNVDELTVFTFNGVNIGYRRSSVDDTAFNIGQIYNYDSPQEVNITIDEYIRYEDIVQPYPVLLRFKDENGNEVSWGGKFKVGSTITRIGSFNDCNLLKGIYTVSNAKLNGSPLPSTPHVVEKSMVFTCTATWAFDNNEPKCILSPRLLRIPNSSYKILGYIPDISGHGNNGVIHNSAYAEGSGVNEDGSYQFDGVDDFVTIPTLSRGGKQVLMKVNWNTSNDAILYDQRNFEEGGNFSALFAVMTSNSDSILAYSGRNTDGKTYIDGILNANITCGQLLNITHNITALAADNRPLGKGGVVIGASKKPAAYCKAAVYDFMLFDNISTDDKIKELNEYVGIEAKVELPPYYWDAYGKTNSDADKDTIQQRGIAVGDYDLTNTNFAYDKMSGFGGYTLGKFTNSWSLSNNSNSISIVASNPYDITLKKLGENRDWEFKTTELKIISNPVSVKFKSDKNIRLTCDYHYYTVGGNSEGAPLGITSKDLIANEDTIITISPISQENIDKYNIDINRGYYLIYFQLSLTLAVNEEVTIEMLPLYPNGLVYDGVEDFSDNKNVPLIDDFTVIAKRTWLERNTSDKPFIIKGDTLYPDGNKNAFLFEYGKLSTYSFGQNNKYDESVVPSLISWATPTSYNGTTSLVRGSAIDTVGIDIAHATKIVLYKLILYPKTIPLLQINFLKNLMEKDEIIDLNNPIFIKNE